MDSQQGSDAVAEEMLDAVLEPLKESVAACLQHPISSLSITRLVPPKEVADDVAKLLVKDRQGSAKAVVLLSSAVEPDLVARGMRRAAAAREALGPLLGKAVLKPLASGEVNGRTFTLLPHCRSLSSSRLVWVMQRWRLRPSVFSWLRQATASTVVEVDPDFLERDFIEPLAYLSELKAVSPSIRKIAQEALAELAASTWQPRYVLMHSDLWKDNILIDYQNANNHHGGSWIHRFVIIDWPGALIRGYGIFDLIRLAMSVQLGGRRLRHELVEHCHILGCKPSQAGYYLATALGCIAMNLGHFPLVRFAEMAGVCMNALADAGLLKNSNPH